MKYNPDVHHRRSIRLRDYNYSQAGVYFVTICTQGRQHLFGEIEDGTVKLSAAGEMVRTVWDEIPSHYPGVEIDQFVTMPNHIHGIIFIVGAGPRACPHDNNMAQLQMPDTGQPQGVAPTGYLQMPDTGQPQGVAPTGYLQTPDTGQPQGVSPTGYLQMPDTGQPQGVAPTGYLQTPDTGQPQGVAPTGFSLSDVVHRFKTMTTKKYVDGVKLYGWQRFDGKLWQRNYWEHIIRNEQECARIRHYIENNPIQWEHDKLNGDSGNQVLKPQKEYGWRIPH